MNASEPHAERYDLDRLRAGDPEAFARLVDEHRTLVLGLGQSMGLAGADLDDAAAEVFASVFRSLPRFEGRSQLRTWIYRIALRSLGKSRLRYGRRRAQSLPEDLPASGQPSPDERLEQEDLRQRIWDAVAELAPREAAAVELHYRREWPLEEIADALDCPVGTVKTLLFRAREQLRRRLGSQEELE